MKKESFPKSNRLQYRSQFLRLQKDGAKYRGKYLLMCSKHEEAKTSGARIGSPATKTKLGITVTTKIDKRAVRRNRLKRYIRESFRKTKSRFIISGEMVIVALNGATERSYSEINREMFYLFYQSGLLQGKSHGGRKS